MPFIRLRSPKSIDDDFDRDRFSDNFYVGLPKADMLNDIEKLSDFIIKKVSSCNKSYTTTNDTSEKFDLVYNTVVYHKILVLLLLAYTTEDKDAVEHAKLTYRKLINPEPTRTNERIDRDLDNMMSSLLISFSQVIDMLSSASEDETITKHNQTFKKDIRYVFKVLS
ncbi:hypothetical protein EB001_19695 [bacterium]|nr:hypothetical protein [bacterium]